MCATLNDNNAKLDNLEKAIRAANERRRKLIEKNKLITYDALSELYGKEGQELIDAVTAEHNLICKLTASGMTFEQITKLANRGGKLKADPLLNTFCKLTCFIFHRICINFIKIY